ncbi:25307_t:CDS:2, partial [Gigaspora margarita]
QKLQKGKKFLPPAMDKVTSSDEEVVKNPVQTSETTTEKVYKILDESEETLYAGTSSQK